MAMIDGIDSNDFQTFDPSRGSGMTPFCPECGGAWIEGDRYCRYCGAKKDAPQYAMPDFACIYGPAPRIRKHFCKQCGHSWETNCMVDNESFCPKCGGEAPADDARARLLERIMISERERIEGQSVDAFEAIESLRAKHGL